MRRLLLALMALCLGIVTGCNHTHTAGVCDCQDRTAYHGSMGYDYLHGNGHATQLPKEMPKGK